MTVDTSLAHPNIYYHQGALGSTYRTDSDNPVNTAALSRTEYDCYGQPITMQAGPTTRYQFAGGKGYQTDNSGLVLCGARYYMPTLGRFMTQDPSGQGAGLNLYEYCSDNPLGKVDPTGLAEITLEFHEVAANAFHAYLVLTDNVRSSPTFGKSWAYSGGPSDSSLLGALVDMLDPFGSAVGPMGKIADTSGLFSKGQTDFDASDTHAARYDVPLVNDQSSWTQWKSHFDMVTKAMNAQQIPYSILGPNSNSYAHEIIRRIGLDNVFQSMTGTKNPKWRIPIAPGWSDNPWRQ